MAFEDTTNFQGKDSFRWWIGQVTDPVKGKWKESMEKQRAKDKKDTYALRCRVRIVGYHDCADDLPDEDLPMAHVLLPPNTTTVGGAGQTLQYQGGEVVVGFFADGDDAQQPVVFGTLFKQPYIADKLKNREFNFKKQTCFVPYTPPDAVQNSGKHRYSDDWKPKSDPTRSFSDGESVKTQAQKQKEAATNITVDPIIPCEDNEIAKISNAMKDFTRKLQTLQELNEANTYIDPVFGGIVDIQNEVKTTANKIHNSMTKLVRRGRSWLIQETLDKLSTTLKDNVPKPFQAPAGQAVKSLSDVIFCNLEKIQDELLDYLSKSLENMIGQIVDIPVCGIENFLGDMFGQINNVLDTSLGGLFEQLNNIQGGGIALPSETFSKAIKFANIITNVLDCDNLNCAEPNSFSSKNGITKNIADSFENIMDVSALTSLVNPLIDAMDGAIEASPTRPDCNTNVLKCGPPRVDFIGSSGQGASGTAVVNALGNIIGVAINGTGFGYKTPPLLSFFDSCDKGAAAGGYPQMGRVSPLTYNQSDSDNGLIPDGFNIGDIQRDSNGNPIYVSDPNGSELGVVGAVITSSGEGYLPNTTETDIDGNVKELVPDPNASYDGASSFVTSLVDVVVANAGSSYEDGDTVTVSGGTIDEDLTDVDLDDDSDAVTTTGGIRPGEAEVQLKIENGNIVGASVVNGGFGFTDLPELTINSDTGFGARLRPVLGFTKVEDAAQLTDTNIPFDRNLPQNIVVTVIDCIHK